MSEAKKQQLSLPSLHDFKNVKRTCMICDCDISDRRPNTETCSNVCRQKLYRRRRALEREAARLNMTLATA